jgi:arginase
MCLALAVGRGNTPLARLNGKEPLTNAANVVLIGRRDHAEPWYGHEALRASAILDLPHAAVRERRAAGISRAALDRLAQTDLAGFWIHLDADVLDPSVMPAVDSPVPDGLGLEEIAELLTPLVRHPQALGLELTIYDPTLDPDRACAARLVTLLERVLVGKG